MEYQTVVVRGLEDTRESGTKGCVTRLEEMAANDVT